ncbi:MAG: class II fructose-bisphosphate aldolase [Nocardioides sp.]
MTVVGTGVLVAEAQRAGRALPAFNVITLEHAEAIVAAATRAGRGVVLALSENAIRYHDGVAEPILAAMHALATRAETPLAIHLDHLTDDALVEQCVAGPLRPYLSSLMYDAGALPYADNLARTTEIVRAGHAAGVWVEAELGYVGGKPGAAESAHAPGVRTDPVEAAVFVARTGVDALAVAVGTSHAMTTRTARLDHERIAVLAAALPVPLVLHGSSGVPDDELRRAVSAGMVKINIGTALNVAMTVSVRHGLEADPVLTDPRRYLGPAREAMSAEVGRLLEVLA